jgi:polysaccharide pyruvyl transferase WcaK-like protein
MGVLEQTVPLRPWQTPYLMFLLSVSGKLFGTKVALVSVGTNVIDDRLTRWLFVTAARLAHYRSFRDSVSRDAMKDMGLDVSGDSVYPDVVFSLRADQYEKRASAVVGVGVMVYSGANEDRAQGDQIRSDYVSKMTCFVLWLVENGRQVRLFTSDLADEPVVARILDGVRARYPDLSPSQVIAEPATSMAELLRQIAAVGTVVATRFHNVLYALRLARPTVAIAYAARLIEQFIELEGQTAELQVMIAERNSAKERLVERQFAELSAVLFPGCEPRPTPARPNEGAGILDLERKLR